MSRQRRPTAQQILRDLLAQRDGIPASGAMFHFPPMGIATASDSRKSQARSRGLRGVELRDKWLDDYLDLLNEFPEEIMEDCDWDAYLSLSYTGVFEDGLVTAKIHSRHENLRLFVNRPCNAAPIMGCSCLESSGTEPCSHVCMLLDKVTEDLEDDHSSLSTRIIKHRFDSQRPNLASFVPAVGSQITRLLAGLVPAEYSADTSEGASLAPIKEAAQQRIAWNIGLKPELDVAPMLQQVKKRGGWTKGRKILLENLNAYRQCFSPTDAQISNLVQIERAYYRPSFNLDSVAAIRQLIGAANVFLEGEPAEVELFDGALRLHHDQEACWLRLEGAQLGSSHLVFAKDCFLHLRTDISRVQVSFMSDVQLKSLQAALKLPRIPRAHEAELLEGVRRLQEVLTIHLPESLAGKVVEEEYRPALLLRSRSDGSLDYGLRLRCSQGSLVKPGSGRMLHTAKRDGESIQLQRSAAREQSICREVAQRFGLSTTDNEGSIHNFETALELIDRLQSSELDSGVELLWDANSEKPLKMLGAVTTKNVSVGITSKRDWFQLSGTCNFGDESIDLAELLGGLHAAGVDSIRGDYVRLGDKGWAKISQALRKQFRQLHDSVNQERGTLRFDATSAPAVRDLLDEQIELQATRTWKDCLARLAQAEKLEPELPKALHADLRDYQLEGFKWLRRLAEWGVGGILADDMGLGKTLQTLAAILDRAPLGPTLVIAPTSVGFNWVRESQRFTPDLDCTLYRETERADFLQSVGPGSLVVCSYGLALRDAEALASIDWATLVLDEAQAIKNGRSKTSAAIATIPADWKVALTGTPVENHLGELWSLFRVVSPGVLGGWDQFRRRFAAPIEKDNDEERRMALRERLKPFMLRRTKEQVLKDLPPRTEMNLVIELSPAERELYDQVRLSALGEVDQIANLPDIQDQRFRILALLTRLRQLACSPRLVHETWQTRSSKLEQLSETLQELREEGHRVLIFSQFVQHLKLIREMLEEEQISYEYLDGSTTAKARQERVDSFQNGNATAFLISLKAGGTGLNLTAADYVIHMDPWWNPAVEDQATDRAHRMGQAKPVMVYRLIAQGTIEEEILKLHESKRDLVAGIMEGTAAAGKLSTEDLMALLRN